MNADIFESHPLERDEQGWTLDENMIDEVWLPREIRKLLFLKITLGHTHPAYSVVCKLLDAAWDKRNDRIKDKRETEKLIDARNCTDMVLYNHAVYLKGRRFTATIEIVEENIGMAYIAYDITQKVDGTKHTVDYGYGEVIVMFENGRWTVQTV